MTCGGTLPDLLAVHNDRGPSQSLPLTFRPIHARLDALSNQRAFQFPDSTKNCEDHPAHRRRGIDGFVEADEIYPYGVEFFQREDEMPHRTCEPVKAPHEDEIKPTLPRIGHHSV